MGYWRKHRDRLERKARGEPVEETEAAKEGAPPTSHEATPSAPATPAAPAAAEKKDRDFDEEEEEEEEDDDHTHAVRFRAPLTGQHCTLMPWV